MVFFKGRDADAIMAALKEFSSAKERKSERPSLLQKLRELAPIPGAQKERHKAVSYTHLDVYKRQDLLPSERAFAYKLKLEALRHQGKRTDLTSRQVVDKLKAADRVGEDVGESARQVQRYIRLTELIPPLLDTVDERKIAFNPAYELSFLTKDEQTMPVSYTHLSPKQKLHR